MVFRTGAYLAQQRRAQHLNTHQLAAALGYVSVVKGARRILDLERDGRAAGGLLDKLIDVLGLDRAYVYALVTEDRQRFEDEWNRWANEPVRPKLRFKAMPAIWAGEPLPENVSREEAIEFASKRAVERKTLYMVLWSRKEEILCRPDGTSSARTMAVGDVAGPYLRIRGCGGKTDFVVG